MDRFKLLGLLIIYCTICCYEAKDINEYLNYYNSLIKLTEKELKLGLHNTENNCLKCVKAAINQEIKVLENLSSVKETSDQSDIEKKNQTVKEVIEKNFNKWIELCKNGFPGELDGTISEDKFSKYFTENDDRDYEKGFESCTANFIQNEVNWEMMDEICLRYKIDLESINSLSTDINQPNKECLDCVKNYINYEFNRIDKVFDYEEANPESYKTIPGDHAIFKLCKEIYINHAVYKSQVEKWLYICTKHNANDSNGKVLEIKPNDELIIRGDYKKLENCMFNYISPVLDIGPEVNYYTKLIKDIEKNVDKSDLNKTETSCLKCIITAFSKQLETIYVLSSLYFSEDSSSHLKEIYFMEKHYLETKLLIDEKFKIWIDLCNNSNPVTPKKILDDNKFLLYFNDYYKMEIEQNFKNCAANFIIIKDNP